MADDLHDEILRSRWFARVSAGIPEHFADPDGLRAIVEDRLSGRVPSVTVIDGQIDVFFNLAAANDSERGVVDALARGLALELELPSPSAVFQRIDRFDLPEAKLPEKYREPTYADTRGR